VLAKLKRTTKPHCTTCDLHHRPEVGCDRGEWKWRHQKGFAAGRHLYGVPQARALAHPSGVLLLVEGVADALRAHEAGFPAVTYLRTPVTGARAAVAAALPPRRVVVAARAAAGAPGAAPSRAPLRRVGLDALPSAPPPPKKGLGEAPAGLAKDYL